MARPSRKKPKDETQPPADAGPAPEATSGAGAPESWLPPPESVVSEFEFVSPSGRRYEAIRTNERDAYDPPERPKKARRPKAKGKTGPKPKRKRKPPEA
jgi:hypothetical protein